MRITRRASLIGLLLLLAPGLPTLAQSTTDPRTVAIRLAGAFPGELRPRFDRETGRFAEALGRVRVASHGIDEANLELTARLVLEEAPGLLGIDSGELSEVHRGRSGGLLIWRARQEIDTLPVVGSMVELTFHEDGHLLALRARGLARAPEEPVEFRVSRGDAGELARLTPPGVGEHAYAWKPERLFVAEKIADRHVARAAWRVHVADPDVADSLWTAYVDARTGEVFRVDSEVLDALISGGVDGRGHASGNHQTGGAPVLSPMRNLYVNALLAGAATIFPTSLNGCDDEAPVVSGDGTTVVYASNCGSGGEIWVIGSDGSGMTQLTSNGVPDHSPSIDDTGSTIVFVSELTGNPEIWKIGSDGTGLTQLTSNGATNARPRITDAGDRLIFASDVDGDFEIYRLEIDGNGLVQLTSNDDHDGEADFSGDGGKIAFVSDRDGDAEIFVMDGDGSAETQLTFNAVVDGAPDLDDAGFLIAFESKMGSDYGGQDGLPGTVGALSARQRLSAVPRRYSVWEVHTDGSGLQQLVLDGISREPDLSGDGLTIAFTYEKGTADDTEIHLFHRPTGTTVELTDDALDQSHPSLSDDGTTVVWDYDEGELSIAVAALTPANFAQTVTDTLGGYSFDLPAGSTPSISARLSGLYARVKDLAPGSKNLRVSTSATAPASLVDMLFNPAGAAELPTTQVTAYQHVDIAHDHAKTILSLPSFGLGLPLPFESPALTRVNDPTAQRNAYYSPLTQAMTFFISSGPGRPNTAYDTVIHHESGHRIDDTFGGLFTFDPCAHPFAFAEGKADELAISTSGSLVIGADFSGPGTAIRDYGVPVSLGGSATRQLDCLDCATDPDTGLPEPHDHGEAFAGFYKDLRALLGPAIADELAFSAFSMTPPDMNSAVLGIFLRDADPALGYGGTGDAVFAPHYDAICEAAAKHGFDCWPRPDWGSEVCHLAVCGPTPAVHQTPGTEWLGATVMAPDGACNPIPFTPDEDGVIMDPAWPSSGAVPVTVTVSVDPALLGSGRYGGTTAGGGPNFLRYLYLNAWLFVDDGVGGIAEEHHVLGTGSISTETGPQGFAPNTIAFDPDSWGGASTSVTFIIDVPEVPEDRYAYVRFRLDYGEDSGKLLPLNCYSDPALGGPCGPARYGEVEDYQVLIVGP